MVWDGISPIAITTSLLAVHPWEGHVSTKLNGIYNFSTGS